MNDRITSLTVSEIRNAQRSAWERGKREMVETFLQSRQAPPLPDDAILELILSEYQIRREFGEQPTAQEYQSRFASLSDQIRRLFLISDMFDDVAPGELPADSFESESSIREESDSNRDDNPLDSDFPPRQNHVVAPKHEFSAGEDSDKSSLSETPAKVESNFGVNTQGPAERTVSIPDRTTVAVPGQGKNEQQQSPGQFPKGQVQPDPVSPGKLPQNDMLSDDVPPATIGRYHVLETVGRGGFGIVYRAYDPQLDREVALKVPRFATLDPSGILRSRELREARAAATVSHPNICPLYEINVIDSTLVLVCAFIPGQTLAQRLKERPLSNLETARLVRKTALALAEAHLRGVIHRDLKPSNLMIDQRGEPVVMDFGLARRSGTNDTQLTRHGDVLGTPAYMSPEQAWGEIDVLGPGTDIYSLGAILYELITGCPPVSGKVLTILQKIREGLIEPPSSVSPDVDPGLESICLRAMSHRIVDRYATMLDFAAALDGYLRDAQGSSGQIRVGGGSGVTGPAGKKVVSEKKSSSFGRRTRWLTLSTLGIAFVLMCLAVFYVTPKKQGWISVEINDPLTEVAIEGTGIVFNQSNQGQDTKLAAGVHTLIVKRGDFQFESDSLVLQKEEHKNVTVTLLTGEVKVREGETLLGEGKLPAFWNGWALDAPPPAAAPFNALQARSHQEAWARYLDVPIEYTNSIGMKFILIPPGEFMMGTASKDLEAILKATPESGTAQDVYRSEGPQHKVILTHPIYLGVNEVTQGQFEKLMGREKNPSHFAPMGAGKAAVEGLKPTEFPVEMVSWSDAAEFCDRLNQEEKRKSFTDWEGETMGVPAGTGYYLPSEAEWEFACRAGTTTKYWTGDNDGGLLLAGRFDVNSERRTHRVGELKANPFGLHDVHGNVSEWVGDVWGPTYYGQFQHTAARDPRGPNYAGHKHAIRGGDFGCKAVGCRSADRTLDDPSHRHAQIGFRIALRIDAADKVLSERKAKSEGVVTAKHSWRPDLPTPAMSPFATEQARQYQESWARHLNVPVEYSNRIGMKFVLIPPGEFVMGATPAEIDAGLKEVKKEELRHDVYSSAGPQHKVILTKSIYLGIYEVTQEQYERVMGVGKPPSHFSPTGGGKDAVKGLNTARHPVEMVSWSDACEFCWRLTKLETTTPNNVVAETTLKSNSGYEYRLPSEAEWEFACRAGTTTRFWSGDKDEDLLLAGWFSGNSERRTHAMGELKANPFGLYEMHGNVCEWVRDRWDPNYYGRFQATPAINPNGPPFARYRHLIRGGAWNVSAPACRASERSIDDPNHHHSHIGFRVALEIRSPGESR
ncbi:MAG: hypothetical protein JWM11_2576 [Planctomycetaceae bacterium]|nr:hypothetical protein [Planctomycetaceae bacterium]